MNLFKSNRVLAMDVGTSDLKLAELSAGKKGMELLNLSVRSLGIEPGSDEDPTLSIVSTIKDVIREKEIRPCPVVLSVSGTSAFLRLVRLPPVKRSKIYQTIQYEAMQNVPFPLNEVVLDYQLMSGTSEDEDELKVLLVAIKTDIVENITDCVEAAGLDVELVDVAPMALYNAVRYNQKEQEGCTLVIDIGSRATNLVFVEEGHFVSRNLPIIGSGNTITQQLMKEFNLSFKDAEELKLTHASVAFGGAYEDDADMVISKVSKAVRSAMTRLHVELERSINFYRNQHNGSRPNRVLLAGGTCAIARMDEFFQEKLKVDVEYFNPFKNIYVDETISTDEISACAHVMGEVVGVGLRHALPCPLEINLLPPKIVARKAFRRKQPYFVVSALCLVLIVLCWWFYFFRMTQVTSKREDKVRARVADLQSVESKLIPIEVKSAKLKVRAEQLAELEGFRTQWITVLDSLHSCVPDGMWLISLTPVSKSASSAEGRAIAESAEAGGRRRQVSKGPVYTHIEIKGLIFADKATDKSIAMFRDELRKSPCFTEETEIQWVSLLHQNDYARGFTIEIALKNPLM